MNTPGRHFRNAVSIFADTEELGMARERSGTPHRSPHVLQLQPRAVFHFLGPHRRDFQEPISFRGQRPALDQLRDLEKKGKLKPTLETEPKDS